MFCTSSSSSPPSPTPPNARSRSKLTQRLTCLRLAQQESTCTLSTLALDIRSLLPPKQRIYPVAYFNEPKLPVPGRKPQEIQEPKERQKKIVDDFPHGIILGQQPPQYPGEALQENGAKKTGAQRSPQLFQDPPVHHNRCPLRSSVELWSRAQCQCQRQYQSNSKLSWALSIYQQVLLEIALIECEIELVLLMGVVRTVEKRQYTRSASHARELRRKRGFDELKNLLPCVLVPTRRRWEEEMEDVLRKLLFGIVESGEEMVWKRQGMVFGEGRRESEDDGEKPKDGRRLSDPEEIVTVLGYDTNESEEGEKEEEPGRSKEEIPETSESESEEARKEHEYDQDTIDVEERENEKAHGKSKNELHESRGSPETDMTDSKKGEKEQQREPEQSKDSLHNRTVEHDKNAKESKRARNVYKAHITAQTIWQRRAMTLKRERKMVLINTKQRILEDGGKKPKYIAYRKECGPFATQMQSWKWKTITEIWESINQDEASAGVTWRDWSWTDPGWVQPGDGVKEADREATCRWWDPKNACRC